MFSVESRLSDLQEQNSFQASQLTVACCSASWEYVYPIPLATFSLFRTREFSGKAMVELTFFFFILQVLEAQNEDEILDIITSVIELNVVVYLYFF